MEESTSIHLKDSLTDVRFEWSDFDGDDCFQSFQISVDEGNQSQKFDFGACANAGLRKLSKFFSDISQETTGLGFRNPDIRYCDLFRNGNVYRLVIQYEGNNLHKEFILNEPVIYIDDAFLKSYDDW